MARTVAVAAGRRKARNRLLPVGRIDGHDQETGGDRSMTRRRSISLAVVVALASLLLLLQVTSVAAKGPKILKFGTMVGVTGSFVGSTNPLRGVNGGGLPWRLNEAGGQLTAGGHLDI